MLLSLTLNSILTSRFRQQSLHVLLAPLLASVLAGCGGHLGKRNPVLVADLSREQKAGLAYSFVPGRRIQYRLDYSNTSNSDLRVLFEGQQSPGGPEKVKKTGSAQSLNDSVRAEAVVTVLDKSSGHVVLAYSLRQADVRLNINDHELDNQIAAIQNDLSREVFIDVNPQGKVLSLLFDPSVSRGSQNLVRALISATQFVLADLPASETRQWETEEEDTAGRYIAHYEETAVSKKKGTADQRTDVNTLRKTVVRYLQESRKKKAASFDIPVKVETTGGVNGHFDTSAGCLFSLDGSESRATVISGKIIAKTDTTIRLDLLSKETLSAAELALMRQASAAREEIVQPVSLYAPRSEQESQEAVYRNDLGNATLEGLLDTLATLEASTDQSKNDTDLYIKFKAMVFLHPESDATIAQILAAADPNSLTMRMLSGALGAVGNPQAQATLIKVIRARSDDWPALAQLIPSVGMVSSPTEQAENTLRDLARSSTTEIASTAQLSLGIMARNLAEESPNRALSIVDWAAKELEAASSLEARRQMLLVLGNAGSASSIPAIARFTSDQEPALRAAALSALRWIDSGDTDGLLLKALSSDADASVRLEAAVALGFHEMTASDFAEQKKAFLTDKDDKVRLAVLNNLWKSHEVFHEVRRLVKEAADNDVSKEVRKAAAQIVMRYPNDYFKK